MSKVKFRYEVTCSAIYEGEVSLDDYKGDTPEAALEEERESFKDLDFLGDFIEVHLPHYKDCPSIKVSLVK